MLITKQLTNKQTKRKNRVTWCIQTELLAVWIMGNGGGGILGAQTILRVTVINV